MKLPVRSNALHSWNSGTKTHFHKRVFPQNGFPHKTMLLLLFLLLCLHSFTPTFSEISSGRIKGSDEPHLVSWRVLEGITEPYETQQQKAIPAWKQMKNAADSKAAMMAIQQALHEYGQLLRHPYMFGEMPPEERYVPLPWLCACLCLAVPAAVPIPRPEPCRVCPPLLLTPCLSY